MGCRIPLRGQAFDYSTGRDLRVHVFRSVCADWGRGGTRKGGGVVGLAG